MELQGKLEAILEPKVVSDNLTTQTFVVKWQKVIKDKPYDRTTAFDQKKTEKYDSIGKWNGIKVGDEVTVSFNEPESREWQGKYFTSVEAWSVKKGDGVSAEPVKSDEDSETLPF